MNDETSMSSPVNNSVSLIRQLTKASANVEYEDAKAILLNSLPSSFQCHLHLK